MTYLELINRVLRRLREPQISSLSGEKALFYGQLVNEAKDDIENAGPWYGLRTPATGSFTPSTSTVDLTSSTNQRSYLLYQSTGAPQAFITTVDEERRLAEVTWEEMDALHTLDPDADEDVPAQFAYKKTKDGVTLRVFPTPDAAYTYRFVFVVPQDELTDKDTELLIPSTPVWREALVRAMEERGEEFNGSLEAARTQAQEALMQAILDDWAREPMTFEAE